MTKQAHSTGYHNDLPGAPQLVTYADGTTVPVAVHRASVDVDHAIARSVSHNEIVTLDHSEELEAELMGRSEDNAENGDTHEFWGTDDDDRSWRVHLLKEEDADA